MNQKAMGNRNIADRLILFLNILALASLLLAYLAGLISPEKLWPLAFIAMSYPIILATIAVFMIYWLLRRKWFLFLNLAFLLFKWDYVSATIKFSTKKEVVENTIKVLSYNVRLFDRYNWSEDKTTRQKVQKLIVSQKPNILCIQEYYNHKKSSFQILDTLKKQCGIKHVHLKNYYAQRTNQNDFGVATLTTYPVINKGSIVLENSRSALAIFTDLLIAQDTIRVYNVHLQSIHLGNKGYKVLDELLEAQDLQDVGDSKVLLGRMKLGFIKRAVQADKIAQHISQSPYPVIVCGDFNDVPYSYTYQTIASSLRDGFSEAGSGLGATYVRVPFFRIDNIVYSEEYKAISHTVHPGEFSDHLAITATLSRRD